MKTEQDAVNAILDRLTPEGPPPLERSTGFRRPLPAATMVVDAEGHGYLTTGTGTTVRRAQGKLKGKAARKQERRLRRQLRERFAREGRELIVAKWR